MTSYVTPKKNSAYIFYVGLPSIASPSKYLLDPVILDGDAQVSIDGGSLTNLTNLPSSAPYGSQVVEVSLTADEMNGDNIVVVFSQQEGSDWKDIVVNIPTSERQIDDLAFPTTSGRGINVGADHAVDSNLVKILSDVQSVQAFGSALYGVIIGSATTDVLTSTAMSCTFINATSTVDDIFVGRSIVWITGVLAGSTALITSYDNATGVIGFSGGTATGASASNGDAFIIS